MPVIDNPQVVRINYTPTTTLTVTTLAAATGTIAWRVWSWEFHIQAAEPGSRGCRALLRDGTVSTYYSEIHLYAGVVWSGWVTFPNGEVLVPQAHALAVAIDSNVNFSYSATVIAHVSAIYG